MDQSFGSGWTLVKLEVIRRYFDAYFRVMKNQRFKLCYIDAFAGSGRVKTQKGSIVGSALQALDFDFNQYYFFEKNKKYYRHLLWNVQRHYQFQTKQDKIKCINGDCNAILGAIDERDWIRTNWRGIIFLDPYAMQLYWDSLEKIKRTGAFDVWYLFPFSPLLRNLNTNKLPTNDSRRAIGRILGNEQWQNDLYTKNPQRMLFDDDEVNVIRGSTENIKGYIVKRLKELFGTGLLDTPLVLKNSKNSTMFLLCFACSNEGPAAQKISLRIAKYLVESHKNL
jgi:three-Cys-motif partner protein